MEEISLCQSCGMPLAKEEDFGNEADGRRSTDYCAYCYRDGAFTAPELTLEQMIEINLQYIDHYRDEDGKRYTADEARPMLMEYLPTLKRWKTL